MRVKKLDNENKRTILRLVELDCEIFPEDTYPTFDASNSHWWGVFSGGKLVAYAGILAFQNYGYLVRCGVKATARGQGLQRRLIRARERWARQQGLRRLVTDTSSESVASMRTLARCGYLPYTPLRAYGVANAVYWEKKL